jgi:hypothetical protein
MAFKSSMMLDRSSRHDHDMFGGASSDADMSEVQ